MKASQGSLGSLLSSVLFVIAIVFLWGIGVLMGITAFASLFTADKIQAQQTVLAAAYAFQGLILLPAAFFAFRKFLQKPDADQEVRASIPNKRLFALAAIAAFSMLIGYFIADRDSINWIILPILTVPVVLFPLAVLWMFAVRDLPVGTKWQAWTVFGLGMTLAPLILFALEIAVLLVGVIGVSFYVALQPELLSGLQNLVQQVMLLGPESDAARELLLPLLAKPGVMVMAFFYVSVLIPAIEELFKPIGVWLFANQLETPAHGFVLGALSGGAYGLLETLNVTGQIDGWAVLLFTRIGTGLLHITTSALMGTAIVRVWRERRYLRLLGTYLTAILLHGLWNALAILFTYTSLPDGIRPAVPFDVNKLHIAVIGAMAILAAGLFAILITSNRRLRLTNTAADERLGTDTAA